MEETLQNPAELLAILGSFWETTYDEPAVVASFASAVGGRYRQAARDYGDLRRAVNRHTVPVFHVEEWTPLRIRESQRNEVAWTVARFDEGFRYDGTLAWDGDLDRPYHAWRAPVGLVDAPMIANRITDASLTWSHQVDYQVRDGFIVFRDNPFDSPLVPWVEIRKDNQVVDRECLLWLYQGRFDRETPYRQFGYAVGLHAQNGPNYRRLLNAVLDAIADGTSARTIREAWSAVTDVPLASGDERVETILGDARETVVVTNREVYVFPPGARVLVQPGQSLRQGDPLTDALLFFELGRGQAPDIPALAVGRGLLSAGYFQDLVFENKSVPLLAVPDGEGRLYVSFALGGWPGDVRKFFDEIHARGLAQGKTLAQCLDTRPPALRTDEVNPGSLPATINPLAFLCQHVLFANAFLVRMRPAGFGRQALDLGVLDVFRKLIPPQTLMIVLHELAYGERPVKLELPGTDTQPGYREAVTPYSGMACGDTVGPAHVTESVRVRAIGGHCVAVA